MEEFVRIENLIGKEAHKKIINSHVAVFGVGGVGGFVVEALARCGVGQIDLYDFDTVSLSNINRQIIALNSTVGRYKVDVMKERIYDINKNCKVNCYKTNVNKDTIGDINFSNLDYVVDAIDTMTAKVLIIEKAKTENINIISCMGTGNKFDPTKLKIVDIKKTFMCPVAKIMRKLLKDKNIEGVNVLYSEEQAIVPKIKEENNNLNKHTPMSMIFIPAIAGLMIAQKVVKDIMEK